MERLHLGDHIKDGRLDLANNMKLEEGVDYYWKDGRMVFTEIYHLRRGKCCGNGCVHCAYHPPHIKGNAQKKR